MVKREDDVDGANASVEGTAHAAKVREIVAIEVFIFLLFSVYRILWVEQMVRWDQTTTMPRGAQR